MITFMPYSNFIQSVGCLDRQRLGSQRREALHILKASLGYVKPYKSYSAIKMWKGYLKALCQYGILACQEWTERGYKDNQEVIFRVIDYADLRYEPLILPKWVGCQRYHDNQKARLLYKNPQWYSQYNWDVEPTDTYWFPESLYAK